MFAVNPLTTTGEVELVPVRVEPPSLELQVASNEVIDTPLLEPGVIEREAEPADGMDSPVMAGAFGGAAGITDAEIEELLPMPATLVAVTTNV